MTRAGENGMQRRNRKQDDRSMAEHKHGEMDTTTQTDTYNGFIKISVRIVIACVVLLVFLAIFRI